MSSRVSVRGVKGPVTTQARTLRSKVKTMHEGEYEVDQSVSVRSGWVWRGFLLLSLLGIGVVIIMADNHHGTLAALWGVITAGWFAISMFLWRKHRRVVG